MPILRTRNMYGSMGPGDVVIAGYFERNPPAEGVDDGMRVTPPECRIFEASEPITTNVYYSLTFPGTGELDIVGICMSYSPAPGDVTSTDIEWPKWDYNAADRTVHIELRKNNSGNTEQLELGEKLYFMAHVYQGAPSPPNLTVRNV